MIEKIIQIETESLMSNRNFNIQCYHIHMILKYYVNNIGNYQGEAICIGYDFEYNLL